MVYITFIPVLSILLLLSAINVVFSRRGPHHPRSEVSKTKHKVDEHISPQGHDIEHDLDKLGVDVDLDKMTEEDKQFYYFMVHDSDNNNALDGLEMLHAALHQNEHFTKADRDIFVQNATAELNHIIDVIDKFIYIADVNNDGYLYYPEYIKAINDNRMQEELEENNSNE
ncbi:unnamed protein product [Hermetia illucens]|uniref:Multiple coagulation factor deficiency protein 2 n=1 Tax=Hermetia illucens TaxID=343691 RepID=A0A7R8Z1E4_HERIL|nr:multiple coagulation factor deficiency protein 2 homolog [Hermetia illucens]XP_037923957.1 multiple coagulation factor deficiency protein 2 homolog [Hermetia illucens]CAD7091833.1 unnamed protein product [Hermetia illucens]